MCLHRLCIVMMVWVLVAASVRSETVGLVLQAGDQVALSITGIEENEAVQISKVYIVSDAGTIDLMHVGEVKAAGLSPSELKCAIEAAYVKGEIYTRPMVEVMPDQAVHVSGGCWREGPVPYRSGMRVMDAIKGAGGFETFIGACPKHIKVIRDGRLIKIDLKTMRSQTEQDVQLQPGDQVIVPE